ncbi:MAG: hypothetical protein IJD13_06095, partial [Oscillospiraceae bacterium]|nr:hypothetical protein [Oscillospiraceae bacterium]
MAKKNYNTKNNTSRPKIPDLKPRMILFLCGFVLFTVIGSFLREPVDPPDYVSDKYIFWILRDVRTFCFEGVARFLGRAVGLPVAGAAGRLFTLVSSLFYLVMSLSLYGAYSGTEMADFGDEPETGVARTVHFIASYPYLARVTYIIIDPKFGDTGRLNPGYNTFILLLFVIALPASLYNRSDDETPVRQKYAARWLSSFGVMLGCAGLGRLIADSALAPKVYAPGLAWSVIAPIAEAVPASLAGMGKILLTFAVLIALVALFGSILLKEKNCNMPFSIVSFALLVGGGLMFYAVRGTDGVEPRAAATWVLMLFAAAVWAMAAPKKKFLVLVSGVGVLFSGTALVTAIRLMRMPFYAAVDALRLELQPLQERALDWLNGIIPHEIIGPILALIVCLLAAFLLA